MWCDRDDKWIREYGSKTYWKGPILTRNMVFGKVQTIEASSKESIVSKDDYTYVPWDTFAESKTVYWMGAKYVVKGIYKRQTASGWDVEFPALGRKHNQTYSWIKEFGLLATKPNEVLEITKEMYDISIGSMENVSTDWSKSMKGNETFETEKPTKHEIPEPGTFLKDYPTAVSYDNEFGVGLLNINGLDEEKLRMGIWFREVGCGVTALVDTRVQGKYKECWLTRWKKLAGPLANMKYSGQRDTVKVGGQAHLITAAWAQKLHSTWSDASDLGIVFETSYYDGGKLLRVISVYRPAESNDPGPQALSTQLDSWLHMNRGGLGRDDYIKEQIISRLAKQSDLVVVMGDFNAKYEKIKDWEALQGLTNSHQLEGFSSRFAGDRPTGTIDFILHNGTPIYSGCSDDMGWRLVSDHRPIWSIFPQCGPKVIIKRQPTRTCKLDLTLEKEIGIFQSKMVEYSSPQAVSSENILHLMEYCKSAATIERKYQKLAFWTPETGALIHWLTALRDAKKNGDSIRFAYRAALRIQALENGSKHWEGIRDSVPTLGFDEMHSGNITTVQISEFLIRTQRSLTGKKRLERYLAVNEYKLGIRTSQYKFYKTLRKPRLAIDLDKLEHDGELLTDPGKIHETITHQFEHDFRDPRVPGNLWATYMSFEEFADKYATIPCSVLKGIWKAIYMPEDIRRNSVSQLLTFEQVTPTYAEFLAILKQANRKSAGGPSGCTYRMMQLLSEDQIKQLYSDLSACWVNGEFPHWWKEKLVYPLAKKPNQHTVKNIRPIVLLETTRKLWYKIISRKISAALEGAGILQDNQYGFRRNRSCSDNLLHLINAMEATNSGVLYATSWDIVGAFNAPPRQWLELSLIRLGVPVWLAEKLAYCDQDDVNLVLTPFQQDTGSGRSFTTGRGCGQGDVISPLLWNCYFDMILTALNDVPSGINYLVDEQLHVVRDTAFADDLLSLGATLSIIQQKAEIMSACSTIFGFKLANDKFRTFTTGTPGSLSVYNERWEQMVVACTTEGVYRYLGSTRNFDGNSMPELDIIKKSIIERVNRLQSRYVTADQAARYINTAILPANLYKAMHGSNLSKIGAYKIIRKVFKQLAHVPVSHPTALTGAPTHLGGLGLKLEEYHVPEAKWNLLQRLLNGPIVSSRHAAHAILQRAATESGNIYQGGITSITDANGLWIDDLVKALETINYTISFGHGKDTNALDLAIKQKHIFRQYDIRYQGDIVELVGDSLRTIPQIGLGPLHGQLPQIILPVMPIFLRCGHFWAVENKPEFIYEIVGWIGQDIKVMLWQRMPSRGTTRSNRAVGLSSVYQQCTSHLTAFGNWRYKCLVQRKGELLTLLYAAELRPATRTLSTQLVSRFPADLLIGSDGSFQEAPGLFFSLQPPACFGAVVGLENSPTYHRSHYCRFSMNPSPKRAFMTELFAIAVASTLTSGKILTDCKSVLTVLQSTMRALHPLIQVARTAVNRIEWTRSHPERRVGLHRKNWSKEDEVIAAADSVAGNHSLRTLSGFEATMLCMQNRAIWFINGPDGFLMDSISNTLADMGLTMYLANRHKDGIGQVWAKPTLQQLMHSVGGSLAKKGSLQKLYLGRFDSDRQGSLGARSKCTCGCDNHFLTWSTTCKKEDIVHHRESLIDSIIELKLPQLLNIAVADCLVSEQRVQFLRGNWQYEHCAIITLAYHQQSTKNQAMLLQVWKKHIRKLLCCLANFSLRLYAIGGGRDKKETRTNQVKITSYFIKQEKLETKRKRIIEMEKDHDQQVKWAAPSTSASLDNERLGLRKYLHQISPVATTTTAVGKKTNTMNMAESVSEVDWHSRKQGKIIQQNITSYLRKQPPDHKFDGVSSTISISSAGIGVISNDKREFAVSTVEADNRRASEMMTSSTMLSDINNVQRKLAISADEVEDTGRQEGVQKSGSQEHQASYEVFLDHPT